MSVLFPDTHPEAEAVFIHLLRDAPSGAKWNRSAVYRWAWLPAESRYRSRPPVFLHPLEGPSRHRQDDADDGHANQTKNHFEVLSAVLAGKAELKEVIEQALERRRLYGTKTILFVKHVRESLNWARQTLRLN